MDIHFKTIPATFHHIPRTAGTSFTKWVEKNITDYEVFPQIEWTLQNFNLIHNYNQVKTNWPNMGFRFSFVRNPYSRLLSLYHYLGQEAEKRVITFKKCLHNKVELVNWKKYAYQSDNIITAMLDDIKLLNLYNKGFDYYIKSLCDDPTEWYLYTNTASHHLIRSYWQNESQVAWFCGVMPDLTIKVENLDKEFYKIQNLLTNGSCRDTLPKINTTFFTSYQNHYSAETKALVSKKFEDDLDTFGYTF